MVHRSVAFVHVIAWVFSAVLAFSFVAQWEEEIPVQATAGLSVRGWDRSTPAEDLYAEFERFARQEGVTFAKVVESADGWYGRRTLYAVDGDPQVDLAPENGGALPTFTRYTSTEVAELGEIGGRTVVGPYVVFGDESKSDELARFFADRGLAVTVTDLHSAGSYQFIFARTMTTAFAVMVLVAVVISFAGVMINSRAYSVNRLVGLGFFAILRNDLRSVAKTWIVSGAVAVAGSAAALGWYNRLFGFGTYLAALVVACLALTACAVAAHALALHVVSQTRILEGVKGEIQGRSAIVVAYAMRVVVIVMLGTLVGQAALLGLDLQERTANLPEYEETGELSFAHLGGTGASEEELEASAAVVGSWVREQERAGNVLLAAESTISPSTGPATASYPMLRVNDVFTERGGLELADGGPYRYGATGEDIEILVPEGIWDHRGAVREDIESYLDVYAEDVRDGLTFAMVQTAADQDVFTYTPESRDRQQVGLESRDASIVTDPVLVVSDSDLPVYSDFIYDVMASQGHTYFIDPEAALAAVAADERLSDYVLGMTTAASAASDGYDEQSSEFREVAFSIAAALVTLVVTVIGTAILYGKKHSQLIFARHAHGWRFLSVHRLYIVGECALLCLLLAFPFIRVRYLNWKELSAYQTVDAPPPIAPAQVQPEAYWSVVLFAAVVVAGVALVLANLHRRVIREGASEA